MGRKNRDLLSLPPQQMEAAQGALKRSGCLKSHLSLCLQLNPTDYITVWCWLAFVCDKLLLKFTFLQKKMLSEGWSSRSEGCAASFQQVLRDTSLCWFPPQNCFRCVSFFSPVAAELAQFAFTGLMFFLFGHTEVLEGLNYTLLWKDLWFGIWFCSSCAQSSLQTNKLSHHSSEKLTI